MVTQHLGNDEGKELLGELGVEAGLAGKFPKPLDLFRFALRVGRRHAVVGLEVPDLLGALEALRQHMDKGSIEIVDAVAQPLQLCSGRCRVGRSATEAWRSRHDREPSRRPPSRGSPSGRPGDATSRRKHACSTTLRRVVKGRFHRGTAAPSIYQKVIHGDRRAPRRRSDHPAGAGGPLVPATVTAPTGRAEWHPTVRPEPAVRGGFSGRLRAVGWPLMVCLLTSAYAAVPTVRTADFYRRGDSAAQFLPTWYHLGELLRSGTWPPVLDPDSWQGGNYAAEAIFGIYNPLNALNWLFVSTQTDLNLSATVVKAEFLTILALGVYLLCREYGAAAWASSIVAVAMPFAGFTVYWEAASWASGLSAFMYAPHVWWAFRRAGRGRLNPFWAFLIGALAVTQGNPYGVLGVVVISVGLVVEFTVQRQWRQLRRLLLTGACVAAVLPLVFLPLLATAPLAHRSELATVVNRNFMRPNLGDLVNLSAPTYLPNILTFLDPMRVPAVYFLWLAVPLLPWLRWSALRSRLSQLAGVVTTAALYAFLNEAPSTLWLFRWPVRLVEYLQLSLAVTFALLLSAGLARDKLRARWSATAALVLVGGYLSWAQTPQLIADHVVATVVVAAFAAAFVGVSRKAPRGVASIVSVAQAGTLSVLALQVYAFPENYSAANWDLPASVSTLQHRLGSYTGTTMQFAITANLRDVANVEGSRAWGGLAAGSVYHIVGVDAVNTYYGIGYEAFTKRLCMDPKGNTHPCGYDHFFLPAGPGGRSLAELMKVDTVIVQRGLLARPAVQPGWRVAQRNSQLVVLHPTSPWPYPDSRLSWASHGVDVQSAQSLSATSETAEVSIDASRPQRLVFARLAWPGYSATLNGAPLQVSSTPAGLLAVDLPVGITGGRVEVQFTAPGQRSGLVLAGLGALVAAAAGVLAVRRHCQARAIGAEL